MSLFKLMTRAAILAALAVPFAAHAAQDVSPAPAGAGTQAPAPGSMSAQSAMSPSASAPASAMVPDPSAVVGSPANPIPTNSPTPAAQAGSLVAGDTTVVSNGPVPDTRANRAKYGRPLSHAGNLTDPAGN